MTFLRKIFFCILYTVIFSSCLDAQKEDSTFLKSSTERLSKAIQIRTISYDEGKFDSMVFYQFKKFLEQSYPLIHTHLKRIIINDFSFIYEWKGRNKLLPSFILMAHSDVVPVEEESLSLWRVPPFEGKIINDTIWGRGSVDDKGSLIAILEGIEFLLSENYTPERTLYFCFGHDEEISGVKGALGITDWFRQQNIRPELVLDEGLEVLDKKFPGLKKPIALIGLGEKGHATFDLHVEKSGGHSSAPENETSIDILVSALNRIQDKKSPAKLIPMVNRFFHTIKGNLPFSFRSAINNQWLFKKAILRQMKKYYVTNAVIRTTIVTTIIKSGLKDNIIPAVATATVNCRILPGETLDDVENFILKVINDRRVKVTRTANCWEVPSFTSIESPAYKTIEKLAQEFFPEATTAPFFVIGATDSRYFRPISEGVINFNPVVDSEGVHGIDERRSTRDFERMIRFYIQLIKS
jgi:carboxypeptidase PM20D1